MADENVHPYAAPRRTAPRKDRGKSGFRSAPAPRRSTAA
jgi:hypothetical protein